MRLWKNAVCTGLALACLAGAANGQVVISGVYGGGGNTGATLRNDYIELFNRGSAAIDIAGYSVQYASAAGTTWAVTAIGTTGGPAISLAPGQYYLIQEASGGAVGALLPTADATGTINLSATNGKVALVSNQTALTGAVTTGTGAGIVDFVGFGTANGFEGSAAAPAGSNTSALFRNSGGCVDTDQNASNFAGATPAPRNTASTFNVCTPSTPPAGVGGTTPASQCPGFAILLTCTVTQGTNPASPISSVVADTTLIGGATGQAMHDDGLNGDVMAGDGIYSLSTTITAATTPGNKNVPVLITDGVPRTGNASITVVVDNCALRATTGTGANPAGVCNGDSTVLTVNVFPGQQPASTGITVTADLTGFFGAFDQALTDNGNNNFTYTLAVPANQPANTNVIPFHIADAQGRFYDGTITVTNVNCTQSAATVVISQVYGGGGNAGAPVQNDFIELYNRTNAPISLAGWSVQYASASGASGFANKTDLTGTIPANSYYLIVESAGTGCSGAPCGSAISLTADDTGTLLMGGSDGRVALVNSTTLLGNGVDMCTNASIVDLVGYGSAACSEGIGAAPALSNTTAGFRRDGGCFDSNNNVIDFSTAAPAPRNSTVTHFCGAQPTGSCCAANGGCTVTTQAACSGTWTSGGSCSPNNCPQPTGACCDANGGCTVTTQAACSGTWTSGGSCSPNNCPQPTGACCCGAACTITSAAACSGTNTRYAGNGTVCNAANNFTTPCCKGDYNKAAAGNVVSVQDIFDFLGGYFSNSNCADTNASGTISVQDIFDFLSAYFGGCP